MTDERTDPLDAMSATADADRQTPAYKEQMAEMTHEDAMRDYGHDDAELDCHLYDRFIRGKDAFPSEDAADQLLAYITALEAENVALKARVADYETLSRFDLSAIPAGAVMKAVNDTTYKAERDEWEQAARKLADRNECEECNPPCAFRMTTDQRLAWAKGEST